METGGVVRVGGRGAWAFLHRASTHPRPTPEILHRITPRSHVKYEVTFSIGEDHQVTVPAKLFNTGIMTCTTPPVPESQVRQPNPRRLPSTLVIL